MPIFDDTRADWSARPPLRPRTLISWARRTGVSWHWIGPGKGPSAAGPHSACLAQVRDWQWQHQHKPAPDGPWKDIGYNGLICQHARAIEGRGLEFSGSHSPGVNEEHLGFQFMAGEDTPGGVSDAMYARARKLRADVGALGGNIRRDWGHRDDPAAQTECPGTAITKWVHSGGPTATPSRALQEDEVTPQDIEAIADEVLRRTVTDVNGVERTVGFAIGATLRDGQRQSLTLEALSTAVGVLAQAKGVDPAEIAALVDRAVRDRLGQLAVVDKGAQA